jgi:SAM-dependent methyltransferase
MSVRSRDKAVITRSNWFEYFFHGVALDLWRKCVTPEQTRAEVDFLEKALGKKKRLLDLPCGNGRHSLELAKRGCQVTGVDLSAEFIQEATTAAKAAGARARFIQGDVRRLRWHSEFDGALCMGNSFGYFEYVDMVGFVRGVSRALKPGGHFVIQTGGAAESVLPGLKEREWYQMEDILFAIQNRYWADRSCLETEGAFVRNGKTEQRRWWQWVYTVGEIRRLLEQAGLVTRDLFGSLDRQPYKLGDSQLLLVAEKPAQSTARKRIRAG